MFVILLTARESGRVILGTLIDSRGKVCLCLLTRGECRTPADASPSNTRRRGETIARDTRRGKSTFLNLAMTPAASKSDFQSGKGARHDGWVPAKAAGGIQNNPLARSQNSPASFGCWLVLIFHPGHTKTHVVFLFFLHASTV